MSSPTPAQMKLLDGHWSFSAIMFPHFRLVNSTIEMSSYNNTTHFELTHLLCNHRAVK